MILHSLEARNFRNLAETRVSFHPDANLIVGDNGQGKTNLLEAIYFLATTRSFRTARTSNLIRIGAPSMFVRGTIEQDGLRRELSIGVEAASERRRDLRLNEEKVPVHRYASILHLFAYSAARLEIIRGGPEERRRFLDRGIATIQPAYLSELTRYGRALQQRNALLQKVSSGEASKSLIDPWDQELATAAMPVVNARAKYASSLAAEFERVVAAHHYHVNGIQMTYQPSGFEPGGDVQAAVSELQRNRTRELAAGFTLVGPHRDTLAFEHDGRNAADVLSSGEIKMTVLFLKFAKISIYRSVLHARPLLLLDDIDAELDLSIMERLLRYVAGSVQIFTTSAKPTVFNEMHLGEHAKILLRAGGTMAST